MKPILLGIFAVFLVASISVFAADSIDDLLDARYDHAECKVTYTIALIDDMVDAIPEAEDLEDYKDDLENDLDELATYASSGDREGFNEYVRETYLDNMQDATNALIDARQNFDDWEVNRDTRIDLRESFEEHKDDFLDCSYDALTAIADAKLDGYDEIMDRYDDILDDLEDKGLDVSELQGILDDAQSDVIDPLQDAVDDATDGPTMREAIGMYCLGNGCPSGENYHFWAWFAVEKFQASLEVMEPHAEDLGLEDDVDEIQKYIDGAEDALNDVGTDFYTESSRADVWDNLDSAREGLRDLLEAIKEA